MAGPPDVYGDPWRWVGAGMIITMVLQPVRELFLRKIGTILPAFNAGVRRLKQTVLQDFPGERPVETAGSV
jgi:hypothetical protein